MKADGGPSCHYFDAEEPAALEEEHEHAVYWSPVYRWRDAYQRSFQARMDWCVRPPDQANREPVVRLDGERERSVAAGEAIAFDASASFDPNRGRLAFHWFVYKEAGTCQGDVTLRGERSSQLTITAPVTASPQTIHLVLAVTNDGDPPLTSYGRVVLTVRPR